MGEKHVRLHEEVVDFIDREVDQPRIEAASPSCSRRSRANDVGWRPDPVPRRGPPIVGLVKVRP